MRFLSRNLREQAAVDRFGEGQFARVVGHSIAEDLCGRLLTSGLQHSLKIEEDEIVVYSPHADSDTVGRWFCVTFDRGAPRRVEQMKRQTVEEAWSFSAEFWIDDNHAQSRNFGDLKALVEFASDFSRMGLHSAIVNLRLRSERESHDREVAEIDARVRSRGVVESLEGSTCAVKISRDVAALLSLSPREEAAVVPAKRFRVQIDPPLAGLTAVSVEGSTVTGEWVAEAPQCDLSVPLANIAWGVCALMAQGERKRAARPVSKFRRTRAAFGRDVVVVKIRTSISDAIIDVAERVMRGQQGYANALREVIGVRGHLARYHIGPGREQIAFRFRKPHTRGKGSAAMARTYILTT